MNDHGRLDDKIAARTEQKLDDFIRQYERDQELSKEWRLSFCEKIAALDLRLKPVEGLNETLKGPLKVIGIVLIAALGGAGISFWKWLIKHWNL